VLLRISKRGDQYLRMLMVEGARSAIVAAARKSDPRSRWITALAAKRGPCVPAVAVANRNARICCHCSPGATPSAPPPRAASCGWSNFGGGKNAVA